MLIVMIMNISCESIMNKYVQNDILAFQIILKRKMCFPLFQMISDWQHWVTSLQAAGFSQWAYGQRTDKQNDNFQRFLPERDVTMRWLLLEGGQVRMAPPIAGVVRSRWCLRADVSPWSTGVGSLPSSSANDSLTLSSIWRMVSICLKK